MGRTPYCTKCGRDGHSSEQCPEFRCAKCSFTTWSEDHMVDHIYYNHRTAIIDTKKDYYLIDD